MEKAKNVRRAAKGKFTRSVKTVNVLRYAERQIQEALKETKDAYKALVAKHDDYTMFLNDEEFDDAEAWLNECSSEYTELCIAVNDYVNKEINSQTKTSDEVNAASIQTVTDKTPITQPSTGSVPQIDAASIQNVTNEQPIDQISDNNVSMTPSESQSTEVENNENPSNPPGTISSKSFYVKHEKPKLPTFYGDVRKYFIFTTLFTMSDLLQPSQGLHPSKNSQFLAWSSKQLC